MPTYDYQCRSCGAVTEVIHSMLEEGPTTCERCGGELRRVFYSTGIIFKGSGFYATDSRSTSSATKSSTPETGTETGSATKPASDGAGPAAGAGETT